MTSRPLHGEVVPVAALDDNDVRTLYAVCAGLYEAIPEPRFRADLAEKDWVVLLRDEASGVIRGFSTLRRLDVEMDGGRLRVVFSGDTGIEPAYWGGQALVTTWARLMGELWADDPGTPLYWFLISKGYRTYLYLPFFFHAFYPRWDAPTPPSVQALIDRLGRLKYPHDYNATTGVVEFPRSHGHLRAPLAAIPPRRQADPHVRFFLARNPGYACGHELVCVAELSPGNMRGPARRALLEGAEALASRAG